MRNWLFLFRPETYEDVRRLGFVGVRYDHRRRFADISEGDRFVAYISRLRVLDGAAGLDRAQQSHKGYKGRSGEEDVAHFDVVLSMQKVVDPHRRADARPVTDAILKERLSALTDADERAASSLQWAHSVLIRDLLVANYDLSDVSFERVRGAWAEGRAPQPSRRRTPKRSQAQAAQPDLPAK